MPTSTANDGVPRRVAAASPLLSVQYLSAGYGGSAVVEGVDLVVDAGRVACVLGPNGAGKSTILKAIVGGRTGDRRRTDPHQREGRARGK